MVLEFKAKQSFVSLIVLLILIDITIILNIPLLRQVVGFIFLTLLPGLLIIQILKLNKLGFTEKVVLSVGLSISFLMLFGLLANTLSLYIGYKTPLSMISLLFSFNIVFIIFASIGYIINKGSSLRLSKLDLSISEKAFLIVPSFFPIMSIYGMYIMNSINNNNLLLLLLFMIPIYVVTICFFGKTFPERLYPIVILLISISLLLLLSLRSNHLIGIDTHTEFYYFKNTLKNMHWNVSGKSVLDATLSISLLPTIYQSILNISPEHLFKILYSLLFSISPLVIYIISKKYVGQFYGFLASCFFMFQYSFFITSMNSRTSLAILFFALLMLVLFNDNIENLKKRVLFLVFMGSVVLSHYSTSYILFFILSGAFLVMTIISKRSPAPKFLSFASVAILFGLIFIWYSMITETAFEAGIYFIENVFINLNQFFSGESRGGGIPDLLGVGIESKNITQKIEFAVNWIIFAFIGIGIFKVILDYKSMTFPELNFEKSNLLHEKFEVGYIIISILCSIILVVMIALPYVSKGYDIQRLYGTIITILPVFFIIGGLTISGFIKIPAPLIILMVLIPYFFFVTGVAYQVAGAPRSMILNSGGNDYDIMYIHDQDTYGSKWLKKYNDGNSRVYTDMYGKFRFISQADFPPGSVESYNINNIKKDGYIYLRYTNEVDNKFYSRNESTKIITMINSSELADDFINRRLIYHNGGVVYK